jgi:hypothetical protein
VRNGAHPFRLYRRHVGRRHPPLSLEFAPTLICRDKRPRMDEHSVRGLRALCVRGRAGEHEPLGSQFGELRFSRGRSRRKRCSVRLTAIPLTRPRAPVCLGAVRIKTAGQEALQRRVYERAAVGCSGVLDGSRPTVLQALFAYLAYVAASGERVWPAANGRCAPRAAARGALPFGHSSHEERC